MKILVASPISSHACDALALRHDLLSPGEISDHNLKDFIRDREVLIFRSGVQISAEVMGAAPELKLLIRAGSGIDNLDVDYAVSKGIEIVRIPEPGAQAVAEICFGFMLALARNLTLCDRLVRQGQWPKHEIEGHLLAGKVLGVVGVGNIGTRIGEMGAAWGMEVVGCAESQKAGRLENLAARGIRLAGFDEVVRQSDYLCVQVPLQESTRDLIDSDVFFKMKPGSYLMNLARGGVVDEAALYEALTGAGPLAGAALDVQRVEGKGTLSRFADLPNVILTPHIGSQTVDTQRQIGDRVLKAIENLDGPRRP